ncbi:hypothetical protein C6P42_002802 [Pichia californica]|nr:hypothetical protein C6P42_002802 [[Candida] californica]
MKLSNTILSIILLFCASSVIAKNVVDLKLNDEKIHNINLEMEQNEFNLGKRESKNVVNLNLIYDGELNKRDSKNLFDTKLIIDNDNNLLKRDSKNVFNINLTIDEANLSKRDGKNVFNINFIIDDDNNINNNNNNDLLKRDSKNVVNFNFIIDDENDTLNKRNFENIIELSIAVPNTESYYSSLQDPSSLGYIIGDDEFIAENVENIDNNNINIKLKHDSIACNKMNNKFNFGHSISKTLSTFKEKMNNPVISIKDKFIVPDKFLNQDVKLNSHSELLEPIKGDIATALVQRNDLGIFSKYLRDAPDLYNKCEIIQSENLNQSLNKQILIFAPTNIAFTKLTKKPWQFPEDVNSAKTEKEEDSLIQRNVLNFVESHAAETENFNISDSSNAVEFISINGKTIVLENLNESFRVRAKDNNEWSNIIDIEILENGAILTIDNALIHN